jgi:hypothetical protein
MGSQAATAATPQPQYTGDLIIKWRDDTSGTRKTLSASEATNRLLSVAQAAGSTLQVKRTLATNAQLLRTGLTDAASIQATVEKIAKDARVAYVVPDRILRPNTIPNDPLFATQNNLASPTLVPGGINAASAWSITQGSTGIVVAVVDTGYTDHPDLSAKILPGYNFISDPARAGNSFAAAPAATSQIAVGTAPRSAACSPPRRTTASISQGSVGIRPLCRYACPVNAARCCPTRWTACCGQAASTCLACRPTPTRHVW